METKNFKSQANENFVEENFVDPAGWIRYEIEIPVYWKDEAYYDNMFNEIKQAQNDLDFYFGIRNAAEWNTELKMYLATKKFFRISGWYHDVEMLVKDYLGFDDFDEKCEDIKPYTI